MERLKYYDPRHKTENPYVRTTDSQISTSHNALVMNVLNSETTRLVVKLSRERCRTLRFQLTGFV